MFFEQMIHYRKLELVERTLIFQYSILVTYKYVQILVIIHNVFLLLIDKMELKKLISLLKEVHINSIQ